MNTSSTSKVYIYLPRCGIYDVVIRDMCTYLLLPGADGIFVQGVIMLFHKMFSFLRQIADGATRGDLLLYLE